MVAAATLALLALPARGAASECEYVDLSPQGYTSAAVVRPVVPVLNVRKSGPGSKIVGKLTQKDWATVRGRCGGWVEIGHGYGTGWIALPLVCQSAPETRIIVSPRQEARDALRRAAGTEERVWEVGFRYCGRHSDEALAWAGREALRTGMYPGDKEIAANFPSAEELNERAREAKRGEIHEWFVSRMPEAGDACLAKPAVQEYYAEWQRRWNQGLIAQGFDVSRHWAVVMVRLDAQGRMYREPGSRAGEPNYLPYYEVDGYSDGSAERMAREATRGVSLQMSPEVVCLTKQTVVVHLGEVPW